MNPTIERLVELQRIDDEIRTHRKQREELATNLDRLKRILAQMGASLDEKRMRLAESNHWHEDKRIELQADNDRINNAKTKLVAVQRTKEYQAMTKELETLRKKYNEDEAELSRLSAVIEETRTAVSAEEAKFAEIQAEVQREDSTSADRLAELDKAIHAVALRKAEVGKNLPKQIVATYERILEKRDGTAVVPVVQGSCTGCKMKLPPQTWVKIQLGKELFQCSTCNRYLYYTVQASQAQMQ
jgi:predicted  nucleic acid-binding Zn-ribbon protein